MQGCGGKFPGPSYKLGNLTGYEGHDYTKNRGPAYSLGLKTKACGATPTPGPYNVGNVDRNGRYPYCGYTMESKSGRKPPAPGPGPLDYPYEKMPRYTPAYSLGLKSPPGYKPFGPSPADYFPTQHCSHGHGWTIAGRRDLKEKMPPPGPNAAVPIENFKSRAPAYSLGLQTKKNGAETPGPGPKYSPGRICNQIPHAYSFGLKHHSCSPPMITYEDNS